MSPQIPQQTDLDRVLADWFAEGPRRAPEAPMTSAIEFARSHPRRRDTFGFLRPDPMASRLSFAPLMRPSLILATVGLLTAGLLTLTVGSGPQLPPPDATASPSPTASPSATPTPVPTPFDVELDVAAGDAATVTVLDRTGLLAEARTGVPDPNGPSVGEGELEVTQVDPTTLQLRWMGAPCRSLHDLTIDPGPSITLDITPCTGNTDTLPIDRVMLLEFASAVDAADVEATVTGSLLPPG